MDKKPKILVVGSLVMDLIVTTPRFANAGETIIGSDFSTAPGGKGANQAIQAARLGADVTMVGMVGNDQYGRDLIASAKESGVDTSHIFSTDKASTAIGNVQIESNEKGTQNRIIVVPGANFELSAQDVEFLKDEIGKYDIVILQHEINSDVNCRVASFAKAAGVPVMLNPAPSAPISEELLSCLTYISPNEHEAEDITGVSTDKGITEAVSKLRELGVGNVLITLGSKGCVFSDGENEQYSNSVNCGTVVDPTAAGDSFIGGFCTAIALGVEPKEALRFANCTAGITVTKMGAQTSLPCLEDVLQVMQSNGYDVSSYESLK